MRVNAVADAGRHRIVDVRHGETRINLLVDEQAAIPEAEAFVAFDPAQTRLYADGWLIGATR